jgi:hypothetical protein
MSYYRVIFVKNEIISCTEVKDIPLTTNRIDAQNGQMIFALVNAQNETEAKEMAAAMAMEVQQSHKNQKSA